MTGLFNRQIDMLVRLLTFSRKQSRYFPPDRLAAKQFAVIAEQLPQLREAAGSQAANSALSRVGSASRNSARDTLFECLDPICRTARSIGRDDSKIQQAFQLPHSEADQEIINKANGILKNAETIKDAFLAHDIDPGFLEELKAAIQQFDAAIAEFGGAKMSTTSARHSIEETMDIAMDAVYKLDGIVPNTLRNDYPALKEWEIARRVARARTSARPAPEPDQPTTTPPAV
jgi:hypothetical protein